MFVYLASDNLIGRVGLITGAARPQKETPPACVTGGVDGDKVLTYGGVSATNH